MRTDGVFRPSVSAWLTVVAALVTIAAAQEPVASPSVSAEEEKQIVWPSPDGKFGFIKFELTESEDSVSKLDLVEAESKKVVLHIAKEEDLALHWHVLWAPDSKRFALMTRLGHPAQELHVYAKDGHTFREVELPKLEAKIPERLKRGKKYPHLGNLNWQEATEWKKDGSLVVEIETAIDGEAGIVAATRTVVLGFDRSGEARVRKSTIKYETKSENED
jgi:hypothetical protein